MQSDNDIEKWQVWKDNPSSSNLSALVRQMQPVIFKAVQVNQGSLSPAIIEAEAKLISVKAFKTFDPKLNVKLSTHLTNNLKKVNRINYQYQELYKVPEDRRIKYTTFQSVKQDFSDSRGRDPSAGELASSLGWSQREVARYNSENRQELSQSLPYSSDMGSTDTADEMVLAYIYNDLTPTDKLAFEYITGYNINRKFTNSEIMSKLKITQAQLSYAKTKFRKKIENARGFGIR